ncbi:hypothetical protein BaRGS_00022673 [Batillaria attramentaria]|uniref:Fibronectin type III domain-containing protein n=1 Tax=Batillaria attramentaria TaxID=370345 RepID=A0ABD0KFV0_9CAEN
MSIPTYIQQHDIVNGYLPPVHTLISLCSCLRAVAQIIRPEEVIILGVIIALWLVAFLAFLRKWSSLRILQPMEPRYKHNPKGLDSVRVVKRAQDSVIYKNYSRKMSVTMVARENRRLQRMHTVPIMTPLPTISMEATGTTEM